MNIGFGKKVSSHWVVKFCLVVLMLLLIACECNVDGLNLGYVVKCEAYRGHEARLLGTKKAEAEGREFTDADYWEFHAQLDPKYQSCKVSGIYAGSGELLAELIAYEIDITGILEAEGIDISDVDLIDSGVGYLATRTPVFTDLEDISEYLVISDVREVLSQSFPGGKLIFEFTVTNTSTEDVNGVYPYVTLANIGHPDIPITTYDVVQYGWVTANGKQIRHPVSTVLNAAEFLDYRKVLDRGGTVDTRENIEAGTEVLFRFAYHLPKDLPESRYYYTVGIKSLSDNSVLTEYQPVSLFQSSYPEITVSNIEPFLDIPIKYDYMWARGPHAAAMVEDSRSVLTNQCYSNNLEYNTDCSANVPPEAQGKLNALFDHTAPNYDCTDRHYSECKITIFSGNVYDFSSVTWCMLGHNCYSGHNGVDFQHSYALGSFQVDYNGNGAHEGVYLAADGVVWSVCNLNTPYLGSYSGTLPPRELVDRCSKIDGYGIYVVIHHDNVANSCIYTSYSHLDSVAPQVIFGARLNHTNTEQESQLGIQGRYIDPDNNRTVIGEVGQTRNFTGPMADHLHFAVHWNCDSSEVDLLPYVFDPYGWSGAGADKASINAGYPVGIYLWDCRKTTITSENKVEIVNDANWDCLLPDSWHPLTAGPLLP